MIPEKIQQDDNLMPVIDESWWESVLAEEIHSSPANKPQVKNEAKNNSLEKKISVNWSQAKDLYAHDEIVHLKVTGHNRGGLLVEGEGLCGFVPFSHLIETSCKTENLNIAVENYLGKTLNLKIIECTPQDGRVVFSERAAQTESGKRTELFHSLCEGQVVQGKVTNITDFGVFVDLGGAEGLIHISELSWGRVSHPAKFIKIGNMIEAQVLDLSPERCRVALSHKRLKPNPWLNANVKLPIHSIQSATISCVLAYGVFARLNDFGIEGLIHVSEIPYVEDKLLKEVLIEGQTIQVKILNLDSKNHRLSLSMRLE